MLELIAYMTVLPCTISIKGPASNYKKSIFTIENCRQDGKDTYWQTPTEKKKKKIEKFWRWPEEVSTVNTELTDHCGYYSPALA